MIKAPEQLILPLEGQRNRPAAFEEVAEVPSNSGREYVTR
jgi:hypothetical protein